MRIPSLYSKTPLALKDAHAESQNTGFDFRRMRPSLYIPVGLFPFVSFHFVKIFIIKLHPVIYNGGGGVWRLHQHQGINRKVFVLTKCEFNAK